MPQFDIIFLCAIYKWYLIVNINNVVTRLHSQSEMML